MATVNFFNGELPGALFYFNCWDFMQLTQSFAILPTINIQSHWTRIESSSLLPFPHSFPNSFQLFLFHVSALTFGIWRILPRLSFSQLFSLDVEARMAVDGINAKVKPRQSEATYARMADPSAKFLKVLPVLGVLSFRGWIRPIIENPRNTIRSETL